MQSVVLSLIVHTQLYNDFQMTAAIINNCKTFHVIDLPIHNTNAKSIPLKHLNKQNTALMNEDM